MALIQFRYIGGQLASREQILSVACDPTLTKGKLISGQVVVASEMTSPHDLISAQQTSLFAEGVANSAAEADERLFDKLHKVEGTDFCQLTRSVPLYRAFVVGYSLDYLDPVLTGLTLAHEHRQVLTCVTAH